MNNDLVSNRLKNAQLTVIRKVIEKSPKSSINLGLGEIQFPTHQYLIDTGNKILKYHNIRYTANAGLAELRSIIKEYYEGKFEEDGICITNGAEEAIFATIFSYIESGDEVLLANPTFLAYKTIIDMTEGKTVYFDLDPENNFAVDKQSFLNAISNKTKAVILNNPSNPLGNSFSRDEMAFFVDTCLEHNLLLIVDEVYRDLYLDKEINSFAGSKGNVVVVSSLSKSHGMTGWRIGWAATSKELIEPITITHQFISTCATYLSQATAIKTLSDNNCTVKEDIRKKLVDNNKLLKRTLTPYCNKIFDGDAAPYLFVKFKDNNAHAKLLRNGVITIPGEAFGSNGLGWTRLSYGLEKDELLKAIDIINKTL